MDLAIRISRAYTDVSEWVNSIECDRIVVFEHEADTEVSRTHIHLLVIGSQVKPDGLKARYKKLHDKIDAKDWSFKKADDNTDRFITYMSKGVLVPKHVRGYPEAQIAELTSAWVEPKTNLKLENGKFVRDVALPGQKTKIELLEQMRSQLCGTDTTRDILKIIRKVLIENKVVIGQFKMMDYYDSLIMYSSKEDWLNGMERKINSRQGI